MNKIRINLNDVIGIYYLNEYTKIEHKLNIIILNRLNNLWFVKSAVFGLCRNYPDSFPFGAYELPL